MDAITAIKSRTSVRNYKPQPIPREVLADLVDCGRLAPTGHNEQAWVFVVITSPERKAELAELAVHGRFIAGAGACVAVFSRQDALCEVEDACAATENIIIAAQAHGLGTCWVNSHRKEHSAAVEQLLKCPEGYELVTMLAMGYPDEETRRPKKELAEVLRWETF